MSNTPRADEHEGLLTDPELKKQADKVAKRTAAILRNDVAELTESGAFLRFFGRYATPALFEDYPVNNGSTLAHFMGSRGLVLRNDQGVGERAPGLHRPDARGPARLPA
jgi:hypothetical protein